MNNNIKYDMTFTDVINEIFETKGWYQGEDFGNGVYITPLESEIRVKAFSDEWLGAKDISNFRITYGVVKMKYRRVYTQPDIMRKV